MIGVRGSYTRAVIEKLSGVRNVMVIGCPSLFSRPAALANLRSFSQNGRPAFAGTAFSADQEMALLATKILSDVFLIEPVNKFNHAYHLHVSRGGTPDAEIPYFVKKLMMAGQVSAEPAQIASFFRSNYRLFRSTSVWYQFNRENVSFTFGTRFHVNMASILSGRPALWVTHDARTLELVTHLNLPNIPLELAANMSISEIQNSIDYTEFFDHIGGHFKVFNNYLAINGLPHVKCPF